MVKIDSGSAHNQTSERREFPYRRWLQSFREATENRLSIFRIIRSAHWMLASISPVSRWAPLRTTEQVICVLYVQRGQNCCHDTFAGSVHIESTWYQVRLLFVCTRNGAILPE